MVEGKVKKRLILSQDAPEAVLELPDGHCNLHLRHEPTVGDVSSEAKKRLKRNRHVIDIAQQLKNARATLRKILVDRFGIEELRNLFFDLGGDYEILPRQKKGAVAREILLYLERRKQVPNLVNHIKQTRPDVYKDLPSEVVKLFRSPPRVSDSQFAQQRAREYKTQPGLR